ncbi:MAG: alpha/beta hydrolase [Pseudobdellovibrio sp.]
MVQIKKTRWIVLRGLGRGCGHWGFFQDKLRQAFPDELFYFLDLPGNGFLNKQISPLSISDYVPFLKQQLAATTFFDSDGPVFGIGLSLGGMVLTEFASKEANLFTQIFLINTSASNFSAPYQRISFLVLMNSVKQILTSKIEDFEMNSLLVTTNLSELVIRSKFLKDYNSNVDFTKNNPITKINIVRQLIAAALYKFPKKKPTHVQLINGANDQFVNPKCSIDIKKKWNCDLVTHPTAGHDIAFEDSSWLIEIILSRRNNQLG